MTIELEPAVNVTAQSVEYAIAHELRSPLRAISSTASILIQELGPSLGEQHRELLQRQAHNATRFGRLIDDILAYSRVARSKVKYQPIDLTRLARILCSEEADVQEGMFVYGDFELVAMALERIIDNARKFSNGGVVHVRMAGNIVSVSDEGVGFDPAHAARIFRPFERLVGDEYPGTGIGLAIAERVVERHGGRIWATSKPGMGATSRSPSSRSANRKYACSGTRAKSYECRPI